VFLLETVYATTKLISFHCKGQVLEIFAIQLVTEACNLIILSLYRARSSDSKQFIERLHATLKYLSNPKYEFVICSDINIDYLNANKCKSN